MRYRCKWEIIREILKIIELEKDAKKTRIMHKAYIEWKYFSKHLEYLTNENFIDCTGEDKYFLTNDGKELLKKLDDINTALNK